MVNTEQFFSVSGNVKPGVDPEQSDYRTLRAERGTCFNPLQALITSPSTDWMHLAWPIQAKIKTSITLFEKCKRIYGLNIMKSEFKNAGTLQLRESVVSTENFSVLDAGADAADGGYVVRLMWILWMTSSLSSHSTSASASELSRLVTHTAVSSPKCNSEKRPLSNSVAFQTLFKWHRYCGILKIHIVRKINTGIRYEPVYRPALCFSLKSDHQDLLRSVCFRAAALRRRHWL